MKHRRFVRTPLADDPLPLFVESIGHNPNQEPIRRPDGYPLYHWLQTAEGEGEVTFAGRTERLPPESGVLFMPGEPHRYERLPSGEWQTLYLTFGGPAAEGLLASLGMTASALYRWEADAPLASLLARMLARVETEADVFGLDASVDAYRFLLTLWKYGQPNQPGRVSRSLRQVRPLIDWMNERLSDPDIDLNEMAKVSGLSSRRLNTLFRELFRLPPYAYLLQLRIRRAREILVSRPDLPVYQIAQRVGFRDASHFVAVFRKMTGVPPEQFRKRYS